jgi:type VI secretion system protein ImpG
VQLDLGEVCENVEKDAAALSFKNILPVSTPYPPPCSEDSLWKLFSNMSLNYIPLTDLPAFRAMIATYAFRAKHTRTQARALERHLQSIQAIESPTTDRLFNGIPRRGAQTKIVMDQSLFSCEGAMYLFGAALNEFLSMYATVNSFHQFIIKEAARGEEYRWPARLGSATRR